MCFCKGGMLAVWSGLRHETFFQWFKGKISAATDDVNFILSFKYIVKWIFMIFIIKPFIEKPNKIMVHNMHIVHKCLFIYASPSSHVWFPQGSYPIGALVFNCQALCCGWWNFVYSPCNVVRNSCSYCSSSSSSSSSSR